MKGENMRVIDISQFNGAVDFSKITNTDGIIIRAGYRGYGKTAKLVEDKKYKENIAGAVKAGFKVGVYFVSQAITEKEGKEEADFVLNLIKDYELALPVYFDSENGNSKGTGRADQGKLTKAQRTAIALAFCKEIANYGYKAGVYASESWFNNDFILADLKAFSIWVAKYSNNKPSIYFDAWQFTSKGSVDGIKGNVDISTFNDNAKQDTKPTEAKKSNEEIAQEVIDGKWGNGAERIKNLTYAGYKASDIQAIVNKKLANTDTHTYYTVKRGDTLTAIAIKNKTTVEKLRKLNNISNANRIYIGQKIIIK